MAALSSLIVGLVGAGVSFYGAAQQSAAAQSAADYNAKLLRMQAEHETEVGAENARRKTRENARVFAQQRQALAANGLTPTSGTPLAIMGETAMILQRDILDMGYESTNRARQALAKASMTQWEGATQSGALLTAGAGGLLTGISSSVTGYLGTRRTQPPTP